MPKLRPRQERCLGYELTEQTSLDILGAISSVAGCEETSQATNVTYGISALGVLRQNRET